MQTFTDKKIVLASKSQARCDILKSSGLQFTVQASSIDEEVIKNALLESDDKISASDIAELLGQTKAVNVSENHSSSFIIGGDQTMSCGDRLFNKAINKEEARDNLLFLRGKTHTLHSSVCVAVNGEIIWSYCDEAHLTMLNFSNEFLGTYLAKMGDNVLSSVGAYQLENLGSLLFEKIEGDYHTILGLPLLPLLNFLRKQNVIMD